MLEIEHFDDFFAERQQSQDIRRQVTCNRQRLSLGEFALSRYRNRHACCFSTHDTRHNEIELSLRRIRPDKHCREIGYGYDLIATHNNADEERSGVRKRLWFILGVRLVTCQLAYLLGRQSEALVPHGKENKRMSICEFSVHLVTTI